MRHFFGTPAAAAQLRGGKDAPALCGSAEFYQKACGVLVAVHVWGLPQEDGFFALHIHEGEACTGEGFADTRGHYDPAGKVHPNHAGDLPPLLSCGGEAYLVVLTDRFALREVVGRTVVIHSGPDDFHTQPSGNAGAKIACGKICCLG